MIERLVENDEDCVSNSSAAAVPTASAAESAEVMKGERWWTVCLEKRDTNWVPKAGFQTERWRRATNGSGVSRFNE